MAKKPIQKTTKKTPKASKETKDAIDFFNDDLSASDYIGKLSGKKEKLKLSPAAGRPARKPLFEGVFNWMEGKGQYVVLAITVAVVSAAIYWMMMQ